MSLVCDLREGLDEIRAIAGDEDIGLRPFRVSIHLVTWSGDGVGRDFSSTLVTYLTNGPDCVPVKVTQMSRDEAIASGGLYTNRDLRVGPITAPYPGGGFDDSVLDPPGSNFPRQPTERIWVVNGPGFAANSCFDKKGEEVSSDETRYVILRQNGKTL